MTPIEVVERALAVVGVFGLIYYLYKRVRMTIGEDAPIRVKSGSLKVESDGLPWEKDDSDRSPSFHYKGNPNRWRVTVWKDHKKKTKLLAREARRVTVSVDGGLGPYDIVFKPNGSARVETSEDRLSLNGKFLEDTTADTRITSVKCKPATNPSDDLTFNVNDKPYLELKPLS